MNDGYYVNGIWLNVTTVLMGLLFTLVSMIADTEIKKVAQDTRLLELEEGSIASSYMSVDQG